MSDDERTAAEGEEQVPPAEGTLTPPHGDPLQASTDGRDENAESTRHGWDPFRAAGTEHNES